MELNEDGYAFRPDELEREDITILDRQEVETRDGRKGEQWIVRRADGSKRLYWAAGSGPSSQVRRWFQDYPGTPLYARLSRRFDANGNNVWYVSQRELGKSEEEVNDRRSLNAQLDDAGL